MRINVALNTKSIQSAVKKLQHASSQVSVRMTEELLYGCCHKIIEIANSYLDLADIGDNVKADIRHGWLIEPPIKGIIKLYNLEDKAVYVEFGVGQVGSENPHVKANMVGYSYDVNSRHKLGDRSWIFKVSDDEDIDIQEEFIDNRTDNTVRTKGSPAVMFLYNAIQIFKETKGAVPIWNVIKIKYWGA